MACAGQAGIGGENFAIKHGTFDALAMYNCRARIGSQTVARITVMPSKTALRTQGKAKANGADQPESCRTLVTSQNGARRTGVSPRDISELIKQKSTFVWLDLQNPQADDIQLLRDEFQFHALSIEDATKHHE